MVKSEYNFTSGSCLKEKEISAKNSLKITFWKVSSRFPFLFFIIPCYIVTGSVLINSFGQIGVSGVV